MKTTESYDDILDSDEYLVDWQDIEDAAEEEASDRAERNLAEDCVLSGMYRDMR